MCESAQRGRGQPARPWVLPRPNPEAQLPQRPQRLLQGSPGRRPSADADDGAGVWLLRLPPRPLERVPRGSRLRQGRSSERSVESSFVWRLSVPVLAWPSRPSSFPSGLSASPYGRMIGEVSDPPRDLSRVQLPRALPPRALSPRALPTPRRPAATGLLSASGVDVAARKAFAFLPLRSAPVRVRLRTRLVGPEHPT
jgi:hypothetical protein